MLCRLVIVLLLVSQGWCEIEEQCTKGYFSSCMLNEIRNLQKTGKFSRSR